MKTLNFIRCQLILLISICAYQLPLLAQASDQFAVGLTHICSLDESGAVICRTSPITTRLEPPADVPLLSAIAAGDEHTCAITLEGNAECWGRNFFRQQESPENARSLVQIEAGRNHTCALNNEGEPICWGLNNNAQTEPPNGLSFIRLAAADSYSCGILIDGNITCWTNEERFQTPEAIRGPFTDLDMSQLNACGLTDDGSIQCWISEFAPPDNPPFIDLAVGARSICGLSSAGILECSFTNAVVPSSAFDDFPLGEQFQAIESGVTSVFSDAMCGLQMDNTLRCWGRSSLPSSLNADQLPTDISSMIFFLDADIINPNTVEIFWSPLPNLSSALDLQAAQTEVFRNGELITTTLAQFSFTDVGDHGRDREYMIRLVDDFGNTGPFSRVLSIDTELGITLFDGQETSVEDDTPVSPEIITGIETRVLSNRYIASWEIDPTFEPQVAGYEVQINNQPVAFTVSRFLQSQREADSESCLILSITALDADNNILDFATDVIGFSLFCDRF